MTHCSVQAYVSRARVESFSLIADMMYVSSNAPRIARSVFEICLRRGWSSCAELALTLCKVCLYPAVRSYACQVKWSITSYGSQTIQLSGHTVEG